MAYKTDIGNEMRSCNTLLNHTQRGIKVNKSINKHAILSGYLLMK